MDDHDWMYTGRSGYGEWTEDWLNKVNGFLETAFASAEGQDKLWCPCNQCKNKREQTKWEMGKHIGKYGFVPGYKRWICHGEARIRDEAVRQRIEDLNADGGVGDMLDDYHEAHFGEGRMEEEEEEPEATAKAYYDMLSVAQQPLHGQT